MSESKFEIHPRRSPWRTILTIATFVGLIILVYSLRAQIVDVIKNLGKIHVAALALLLPLQALNYDAYARLYRHLFHMLGKDTGYWPMYRFTLELNFVNHILPSGGVSGISYFGLRARSLGISASAAALAQIMRFFLLFVSFQPLLVLGITFLAIRGHVNNLIMVTASSLITALIIGTFIGIYIIESRSRINSFLTFITKALNSLIKIVRPKHPDAIDIEHAQSAFNELHDNYMVFKSNWRNLKKPFLYMLIANATEVACVYVVYIAFGELVNLGAVILAYAVANFAGLISVLPAGIGVYEGLMTAILAATGISASLSIPVTIMYRVVNMFIQLLPGYYFYQKALRNSGFSKK